MPVVTVVIPCRNEVLHIAKTIEQIFLNDYPKDDLKVVVVDGKSTDGTSDLLHQLSEKYKGLTVVQNPKQITPVAFNIGIKHAAGSDYVLIAGARHLLSQHYIRSCVDAFSLDPSIGCAGGLTVCHYTDQTSRIIALAMSSPFGVGASTFRSKKSSGYVDTVTSAVYPLGIFNDVGLFNEDLVRNQDDEFNFRLTQKGYKIYLTIDAQISYFARSSFSNLFKQHMQYGYWKVYVNQLHRTITTIRQLFPAFFVLFLFPGALLLMFPVISILYMTVAALYIMGGTILNNGSGIVERCCVLYAAFLMHTGYGLGYLRGLYDFVLMKRKPADQYKNLTR